MKTIETPKMPKANGHYSQCIEHNGILYLSGQLPIDQNTKIIPESIEEQTDLVLKNIETILISGIFRENQIFFKNYGNWMRRPLSAFTYFFIQKGNNPIQNFVKKW